jgi:hypothetical protein
MARRRARKMKRRAPRQASILGFMEAYAQGNLLTQTFFNANPISFLIGDAGVGFSTSGGTSLLEIIKDPSRLDTIAQSRFDAPTIGKLAIQSAVTSFGFRMAKRALRKPIGQVNRTVFKPLALGVKL